LHPGNVFFKNVNHGMQIAKIHNFADRRSRGQSCPRAGMNARNDPRNRSGQRQFRFQVVGVEAIGVDLVLAQFCGKHFPGGLRGTEFGFRALKIFTRGSIRFAQCLLVLEFSLQKSQLVPIFQVLLLQIQQIRLAHHG